jgi:hypothetical protein
MSFMKRAAGFLLALTLMGGLSACVTISTPTPDPTPSPSPSPSPTMTVAWFPPTETPTPLPSPVISPTPELLPEVGEVFYQNEFGNPAEWTQENSARGSVNVEDQEITLAIKEPRAFLFSVLEEPVFGDFYVEITTQPSLCRGKDEYGLMFRATQNISYYRYSLSCDGDVRLDVVLGGSAYSPQPWQPSASVPPGAPSQSRIGVWARGSELRFFVNGEYQFTVNDQSLREGSLGVFARSAGENAVTVSFSDLVVRRVKE